MTLMNFVIFMLGSVDQTLVIKNQEWFLSARISSRADTITYKINSFIYITLKVEANIQVVSEFF